jgi:8-oxo-dGTP pyrophosphatase MutT (NUDIX family)
MLGVVLFVVSVLLFLFTGPIGFLYGLFYTGIKSGLSGVGRYLLQIAISLDQLGNVLMQHLLNFLWIKKSGYPFGNRDETISSALGRNKQEKSLTPFGEGIDRLLDVLDPNHTLNSIDFYVEPTSRIIEAVCWLHLRENKVLCSRSKHHKAYLIPGGKRQADESDHQALAREIQEELGIALLPETLIHLGIFEGPADDQPAGVRVRLTCYEGAFQGVPAVQAELEELVWLGYADRNLMATADRLIFDLLHQQGRLS